MNPPDRPTKEQGAALRKLAKLELLYHDGRLVRFERLRVEELTALYRIRSATMQCLIKVAECVKVADEKGGEVDPETIEFLYDGLSGARRACALHFPFPDAERAAVVQGMDFEKVWGKMEDLAAIHQGLLFTPNEQPLLEQGLPMPKWDEPSAIAAPEWLQTEWNAHIARQRRILAGFARLKAADEGEGAEAEPREALDTPSDAPVAELTQTERLLARERLVLNALAEAKEQKDAGLTVEALAAYCYVERRTVLRATKVLQARDLICTSPFGYYRTDMFEPTRRLSEEDSEFAEWLHERRKESVAR
jgi:hypothetical protein